MRTLIRGSALTLVLFSAIQSCTFIADVDRDKIEDPPSGGTGANAGSGGSGGSEAGEGGAQAGENTGGNVQGGEGGADDAGAGGAAAGSAGTSGTSGTSGASGTAGTGTGGTPAAGGAGAGGEGGLSEGGDAGAGGAAGSGGSGGDAGGEGGAGGSCSETACGGQCVDTSESVAHCGACDRACSTANVASAACESGRCEPTCDAGFGDCVADDGSDDDGCETNLETSVTACGACGRACGAGPGTLTLGCAEGVCEPTCRAGFADCSVDTGSGSDNGCETYLFALDACGTSCGARTECGDIEVCNAGVCGAAAGLAVLTVPLAATTDSQRFVATFAPALNLTGATVSARVYAPGATGGELAVSVWDSAGESGGGTIVPLVDLADGWADVTFPAGTPVAEVRLEVEGGASTTWASPTVVYVDSVLSSNGALAEGFVTTTTPLTLVAGAGVTGSTLTWTGALPP